MLEKICCFFEDDLVVLTILVFFVAIPMAYLAVKHEFLDRPPLRVAETYLRALVSGDAEGVRAVSSGSVVHAVAKVVVRNDGP